MSETALEALVDPYNRILVSAVVAWEYTELNRRGRFGGDIPLDLPLEALDAQVIDMPAATWRASTSLPLLHKDPIDRMLIAHGIASDTVIVTADSTIRTYPIRTLW